MSMVAVGMGAASMVASIGGSIMGSNSAKKRQKELEKRIKAVSAKVAASVRKRLREADKLEGEQLKFAEEQADKMLEQYANMTLKYQGIYARNETAAYEEYGKQLELIEQNIAEELGISQDIFSEYNAELDSLYTEVKDLVQVDLAYNRELKDEFKTDADEAIRNTWEATDSAKIDLKQLEDSGGRPLDFDNVVAKTSKAFGDIQKEIDRSDAGRGQSDLTGKKMTTMFAEAMAQGDLAANANLQGQDQKARLRQEVISGGNTAMNQGLNRIQGAKATENTAMAELLSQFGNQKLNSMMSQGSQELAMIQDSNQREAYAQELYQNAMGQLRSMLDAGEISLEEFKYAEQKSIDAFKMGAITDNFNYKDNIAQQHENAMLSTIGAAQREHSSIDSSIDWKTIGNSVGGFIGGMSNTMANKANENGLEPAPIADPNASTMGRQDGGYTAPAATRQSYTPKSTATPSVQGSLPGPSSTSSSSFAGGPSGPSGRSIMPSMVSNKRPTNIVGRPMIVEVLSSKKNTSS